MIRTGTLEAARAARHREVNLPEGYFGAIDDLIVPEGEGRFRPQGFLVQQAPNWNIPAHYHRQAQFQVVVRGEGMLGRHRVSPVCVHYTSRESGYGPVVAGGEGLWYFTLRAIADTGIWYLPEKKADMTPGLAKTHATSALISAGVEAGVRVEPLIDRLKDGAVAWLLRVGPNERTTTPEGTPGAGRFHVVVGGSAVIGAEILPPLAIAFSSDEDSQLELQAGAAGLELLVLEFPASP